MSFRSWLGLDIGDPVKLPKFGSTKRCNACGGTEFFRVSHLAFSQIGLPPHIVATCSSCNKGFREAEIDERRPEYLA